MARSKNLHFVQVEVDLEQPDNPDQNWGSGVFQVDLELSKKYGRTIRNGNNFRLAGYGVTLRGKSGNDEIDTGFACTVGIEYCPTTKHGTAAWNHMFRQWAKQKQLKSKVGSYVRYDDLEMGWSPDHRLPTARNSTIQMGGLDDPDGSEQIVLYGTSVSGDVVTLANYWDLMRPIPPVSEDPFGQVIKEPKYTNVFPDKTRLYASSTFSANVEATTLPDSLGGAIATSDIEWLPSDNHLNHMTGTLYYFIKGIPGDTGAQLADELTCVITLVYEGWNSLVPASKSYRRLGKYKDAPGKSHASKKARRRKRWGPAMD